MHILNIQTPIITSRWFEVRNINFFSNTTFLDADVIFWDIQKSCDELPGGISLNITQNISNIENLKKLIDKRKKELDEFFKIGRTLVITNPIFLEKKYRLPNGEELIESLSFIDCINIEKPETSFITGKNIQTVEEDFVQSYYNSTRNIFSYNLKIDKSSGIPLFYIKDTNYVVAEYYKIKNGLLVILPDINFKNQDDNGTFLNNTSEFLKILPSYNLPKELIIPDWVNNYALKPEQKEIIREKDLNEKLEKIRFEIQENKIELDNYKFLKLLFSSGGSTLEDTVKFVFINFGFELEEPEANRDDLIIKSGKKIGVVEIKGLTKSAAEKNAAQLQKWVSTYHSENNINPKGILVVNTFKNIKLEDRTEQDFPNQMLPYANQMKHCLISGVQLLCLYLDFKSNNILKKDVHKLLFETNGVLNYKKDYLGNLIIP